ncbi:MAG TPA: cytochrome c-type biogenesis protein CcmH [Candidatus Acidoferrum sp.]|nr:cytochrome c-type biogenesis protein CcmH [Candidatus Acidoferrum sp.]
MIKFRRIAAALVLLLIAIAPLMFIPVGAQQLSDRGKQIGGKFMCMCGCSQVLTQCNHVGCTTSAAMLKEMNLSLSRGDSEDSITQMFVQEFGTKVYAEPPRSGFSLVAWVMPSVYLLVGTVLVIFVIFRWRKHTVGAVISMEGKPGISPELLERGRAQAARETED